MPYSVPYSDSGKTAIVVNDLTENNTSTSLSLVGRNYSNYGVAFAKNFVHLLENFANSTAPNNSIEGQLWYNSSTKRLYVNDSTGASANWRPASGTHVAPTTSRPTNPLLGDLWVDTLTQQLSLYNGQGWVLVGPSALAGRKSGLYVEQLVDSSGVSHFVTSEYSNDVVIKITATESFIPQQTIEGFVQINPGINVSSKLFIGPTDTTVPSTPAKIYGTATVAESLAVTSPTLETVSANDFARRDSTNIFYGQQIISNDAGVLIGTTNNLSIGVVQGTAVIKNASDGGSIDMIVNYQGANNIIVKVDGRNRRVGINTPTPTTELDVVGGIAVSGTVVSTSVTDSTTITSGAVQVRGGLGVAKNVNIGKNLVTKGYVTVGKMDESNNLVPDTPNIAGSLAAIVPQQTDNATPIYDIGTPTRRFRTVYADNFAGQFTGTITTGSVIQGNIQGTALALKNATTFSVTGDLSSPTVVTSNLDGTNPVAIPARLSDAAFTNKTEVVDNRPDDALLVYRANQGLRRVTRTNFLLGEAFVPIGSIFPYASTQVPLGYLLCDGALVSRTEYPYLYQVIGTQYGSGAGGNYFRLPDFRGRFPLGNANMANALSNPTYTRQLQFRAGTQGIATNQLAISSTDSLAIGMTVVGTGVPAGTVIVAIPESGLVTTNNDVTAVLINTVITFTLVVLKDSIPLNSTDRVSNITGNNSASSLGGTNGRTGVTINTVSGGSGQIQVPTGAGQTLNTNFDVNFVNPYLTINYIIRAGVGSTQV